MTRIMGLIVQHSLNSYASGLFGKAINTNFSMTIGMDAPFHIIDTDGPRENVKL